MSGIIYHRHECAPPISVRGIGFGSVWQCECGNKFERSERIYASYGITHWTWLPAKYWDEKENRPLTQSERFALIPLPTIQPTKWQRFVAFLKRDNK